MQLEINDKILGLALEMSGEHDMLLDFANSINGVNDMFLHDTLEDLYTEILEFLPEDLMEKVVEKFDGKMTEILEKLAELEKVIDVDSALYNDNCGADLLDILEWAKLGVDKSGAPPLK